MWVKLMCYSMGFCVLWLSVVCCAHYGSNKGQKQSVLMLVCSHAGAGTRPANATTGFMETHGAGVCRGAYARVLAREWAAWDKKCARPRRLFFSLGHIYDN